MSKISINRELKDHTTVKLEDIDGVVDASCEAVMAYDILDDAHENKYALLSKLISKVRKDGSITICGLDVEVLAYKLAVQLVSVEDFTDVIYRKNIISAMMLKNILTKAGLIISSISINTQLNIYEIVASKP